MVKGNRQYKDRLFRFIFNDKKRLLSLYNALNHSQYQYEDELEINTLEDFIYIGMKNDISFILDSDMCLYEHQSTLNPNMPLRGLFYFSALFQKYISEREFDIYGEGLISIPVPKFVVFYNGDDHTPEQSILKLSDAFVSKNGEKGDLEVQALVLDINVGKNKELTEHCKYLKDYTIFVGKVKDYKKEYNDLSVAIDKSIRECVKENIMADILTKHRAEVAEMIFKEFDEAEYLRLQQKKQNELKEEIRQAKERAEESEKEAERLRKILEAHGWSE